MAVKIEIRGIDGVNRYLKKKSSNIKDEIKSSMRESSMLLKEEVQSSIQGHRAEPRSVDTGEFLNSIRRGAGNNSASVASNVKQALFMEYGTTKIHERRHFRNSLNRLKPVITKKIQSHVKTATRK